MEPARPLRAGSFLDLEQTVAVDKNLVVSGEAMKLTLGKVRAEKIRDLTT